MDGGLGLAGENSEKDFLASFIQHLQKRYESLRMSLTMTMETTLIATWFEWIWNWA